MIYPFPFTALEKEMSGACLILNIYQCPTVTLVWKQSHFQAKAVFLFIPGNPGIIEYYFNFLKNVYETVDACVDIYAVQHINHSHHPCLTDALYGLQDQIDHKVCFLDHLCELYPPQTRFFLCGHSIGAYICLKLLQLRGPTLKSQQQLGKVFFLFPTLENIRRTPNGFWFQSTLWLPSQLSKWFGQLIWKLPHRLFLQVLTSVSKQKEWQVSLAQQVFHPYVLSNLMHLCREEMLFVKDLDLQCIQTYLPSLVFYYGVQDHWVPLDMWKNLKQTFPEGEIYLCNSNLPHAFVLKDEEIMPSHVSNWILNGLN